MQPRSLGKKKTQSKGVRESSTFSLLMKGAWVERGGRAQRREKREVRPGREQERFLGGGVGTGCLKELGQAKGPPLSELDLERPGSTLPRTPKEGGQNVLLSVGRIDFPKKNSTISSECPLQSSLICPGGSR